MTENFLDAETYYGATKQVPLSALRHRVSAYLIIIQNESMLLIRTHNNRYYFPGGGVNVGESLQDALQREAHEELNSAVEIGALLYADDMIYYHDPADKASQLIRLYYAAQPLAQEFTFANAEERDEILGIEWVSLRDADPKDFLPSTWRAFNALRQNWAANSSTRMSSENSQMRSDSFASE